MIADGHSSSAARSILAECAAAHPRAAGELAEIGNRGPPCSFARAMRAAWAGSPA